MKFSIPASLTLELESLLRMPISEAIRRRITPRVLGTGWTDLHVFESDVTLDVVVL